jgi:hypothetical protein
MSLFNELKMSIKMKGMEEGEKRIGFCCVWGERRERTVRL